VTVTQTVSGSLQSGFDAAEASATRIAPVTFARYSGQSGVRHGGATAARHRLMAVVLSRACLHLTTGPASHGAYLCKGLEPFVAKVGQRHSAGRAQAPAAHRETRRGIDDWT
jgi:hypothetical protein